MLMKRFKDNTKKISLWQEGLSPVFSGVPGVNRHKIDMAL
jgi:hypothetical protein